MHTDTHATTRPSGTRYLRYLTFLVFLAFSSQAHAADKYWIGSTAGNFNDNTRWSTTSGGANNTTAPGSADVALFDDKGTGNCTFTADANAAGINIVGGGTINTVAGNGTQGYGGDNGAATSAELSIPRDVRVDSAGNIYIVDSFNHRIRKVNTSGTITTVVGTGTEGSPLSYPRGVAVDSSGNIYIGDSDQFSEDGHIRKQTTGSKPTLTTIYDPFNPTAGLATDGAGNLYIVDLYTVVKRTPQGTVTTVIGNGTLGFSGDGGPATSAQIRTPSGVAVDSAGNIYITDTSNQRVRKVNASDGKINTIAGTGTAGFTGDGGPATSAKLNYPRGVAVDAAGNVYIADQMNWRIRKVNASDGKINTIAGTGTAGFSGDGGPATSAQLSWINGAGVALDANGTIYVADTNNHRIRKFAQGFPGTFSVNAGVSVTVGASGFSLTGGAFTAPAATMTINGPFTVSSGTFNHNNGTIVFSGTGAIDVPSTLQLYNVTLNAPAGTGPTIASGDTITANGTLTLTEGTINGATLSAKGPVSVAATFDGGTATLQINGSVGQTVTVPAGAAMPQTTLNNGLATLNLPGSITFAGTGLTAQAGSISASGVADLTFNGALTLSGGSFVPPTNSFTMAGNFTLNSGTFTAPSGTATFQNSFTVTGGTLTHNNGTVVFPTTGTIDVPVAGVQLYNVMFNPPAGTGPTIASGDTVTANGTLTLQEGLFNTGTVSAKGPVSVAATFDGGTGTLLINGTSSQTLSIPAGSVLPRTTVNNSLATLILPTSVTFAGTGLTAQAGTVDGSGVASGTITGAFTLSGGTFLPPASFAISAAFSCNAGTLNAGALTGFTYNGSLTISGCSFTPPTSEFTMAGNFTLNSGTFTASSGTVTFAGSLIVSGGTFNHNNGTVILTGGSAGTLDVPAAGLTLNNLTLNSPATGLTSALSETLAVNGILILQDGLVKCTINAKGPISVASTFDGGSDANPNLLLINGTSSQSFTVPAGAKLPRITLNQAATTISFTAADYTLNQLFTLQSGTFLAASGITSFASGLTVSGGTFDHNNGTVAFTAPGTIDVPIAGLTVNHLRFSPTHLDIVTITSGDTLTAAGDLTITNGQVNAGTIAVRGSVIIGAAADGGTAAVQLTGTTDQTITQSGGVPAGGLWTINKPSGVARLASALNLSTSGQDLTVAANNTLDLNNFTLTVNDTLTNNGTILAPGGGTPIASGTLLDTGTITYAGDASDTPVTIDNGTYGNLTLNNPGTTFSLSGATTVSTALTVEAESALDVNIANHPLTISGNWANNGTFVQRNGTVTFGGTTNTLTSGPITFYNLVKSLSSTAGTLTLPAGITTTVTNNLSLQGKDSGNLLSLRSSVPETQAKLTLQAGATQGLYFLDVKDSDASGGQQLIAYDSVNSGNNLNWSFQAIDLTAGLVGHWRFDNDAQDASTQTNHGTVVGVGPTYSTSYSPASPNTHALDLTVGAGHVDAGSAASLAFPAGEFTFAAWVSLHNGGGVNHVLAWKEGEYGLLRTGVQGNTLAYKLGNTSPGWAATIVTSCSVSLETWTHLTFTYSAAAGTASCYTNGQQGTPQTATGAIVDATPAMNNLWIGDDEGGLNPSYGSPIDDVRIYNRALTAVEIGLLASRGSGRISLRDTATGSTDATNGAGVSVDFTTLESDAQFYCLGSGCTPNVAIPALPSFTTTTTLSAPDGSKTVYATIRRLGPIDYTVTDTITLDTTTPAAPTGLTLTPGADGTSITANVTAPAGEATTLTFRYVSVNGNTSSPSYPADATSGTAFGVGSVAAAAGSAQSLTASSLPVFKTYGVRVWAQDAAGNSSAPAQGYLYLGPPTPRLVITAPSSAVNAVAGTALTLTITAKDGNNAIITGYGGPYTLNWTPMSGTAVALVTNNALGWANGVVTANVTVGGSDAGPGTFTAVDNSGNDLTTGSLAFTFYPSTFTVAATGTSLIAGEPFPLTVTAKDSVGAVMTRYTNAVGLFAVYINPSGGAANLSVTSMTPAMFASGIGTANLHYPDAGQIQILARDTTYATGVTIQGTSSTLSFKPKSFKVEPMPLPAALTKPYLNQPFEVRVTALAADGTTVTGNYAGTVTLTGQGFGLTGAHTFVPAVNHGVAIIPGVRATSAGSGTIKAAEGAVTGESAAFGARDGVLVLGSITGQPGPLNVNMFIKDRTTGSPVAEDSSTRFTISLANDTGTSPAIAESLGPFTLSGGAARGVISKSAEGSVTVNAAVQGFPMAVEPATLTWSPSANTSSTTTFQVMQFEQAAGTTTLTAPAPSTTDSTTTFLFMPPPPTTTTSPTTTLPTTTTPVMTTSSYQQYQQAFLGHPAETAAPFDMSTFTFGGTRYDAAVTMGYRLIAAPPSGDTYQGYMSPGFSPLMMGPPPAAMRGRMEGMAQTWKDSGKLNIQQFDMMMDGIQTGQKPAGADALFGAEMGGMIHQEFMAPGMFQSDSHQGDGHFGDSQFEDMAPAWMMGPGSEGAEDNSMIFDPTRGGWLHEDSDLGDFWGQDGSEGEDEEGEQDGEPNADPTTTTTPTTPTLTISGPE